MSGGSEWAKYTPEQRAARSKAQSERCRLNNLKRSKEMRTRIARNMGLKNKGRKLSKEQIEKQIAWMKDPAKYKAYIEKQRRITTESNRNNPELREIRANNIRKGAGSAYKKTASEEDWWARNFKVARHRRNASEIDRKLNSIGLTLLSDNKSVSQEYLSEIEDFFGEIW